VDRLRRVAGTRRVGHAGTLDPFATGLLLLAWGRATRLLQFLSGAPKTYRGVMRLGVVTDTGDPTGRVLESRAPDASAFDPAHVERAAAAFRGAITQRAPAYSALKQGGEALYKKARRGEVVEPPTRTVTVHALAVQAIDPAAGTIAFEATCSSGTYIRSLAEDWGRLLGPGASLVSLRRTAIGPHSVDGAIPTNDLLERPTGSMPEWNRRLVAAGLTPEDALAFLPGLALDPAEAQALGQGRGPSQGRALAAGIAPGTPALRLTDARGALLAVAGLPGEAAPETPLTLRLVWAAAETSGTALEAGA
jgi:tRNA pseudouridine55 synthase